MDDNRDFYMTPLRPVTKKKAQTPYGLVKGYDLFDTESAESNYDGKEIKPLYMELQKIIY